ncbi:hypothetical protein BJ742DRAFT_795358 [Cladochytrium replicatum]|nr:hypothetical protein BJ742DRAFT_795358 [Cladochytrium replicatum]
MSTSDVVSELPRKLASLGPHICSMGNEGSPSGSLSAQTLHISSRSSISSTPRSRTICRSFDSITTVSSASPGSRRSSLGALGTRSTISSGPPGSSSSTSYQPATPSPRISRSFPCPAQYGTSYLSKKMLDLYLGTTPPFDEKPSKLCKRQGSCLSVDSSRGSGRSWIPSSGTCEEAPLKKNNLKHSKSFGDMLHTAIKTVKRHQQ